MVMMLLVALVVLGGLGLYSIILARTNTRIPLPLRVLPVVGWLVLIAGASTGTLVVTVIGLVIFGAGLTTDIVYERVLGGGGRGSSGRHGMIRRD